MSTERISSEEMNMSTLIMYEETEGDNADSEECDQVDDFDTDINLDSD